jgi:ligand-binding sensor domain-containing protein
MRVINNLLNKTCPIEVVLKRLIMRHHKKRILLRKAKNLTMMKEINLPRVKQLAKNISVSNMIIFAMGCSAYLTSPVNNPPFSSMTPMVIISPSVITSSQLSPQIVTQITPYTLTATPTLTSIITPKVLTFTPQMNVLDSKKWERIIMPSEGNNAAFYQIAQDENGVIWFLGYSNNKIKAYRYDLKNWVVYDPEKINLNYRELVSLTVESGGTVWFGTTLNEIIRFDGKNWTTQPVEEGGYRINGIASILIRKNGELCAVSNEGMSCKKNKGQWIHHPIVNQNKSDYWMDVQHAILSSTDEIWVSLSNGWLYHYDGKTWESNQVSKWLGPIASASDGSLWIYANEGLLKRTVSGNIYNIETPDVLRRDNPKAMYEARDGTLWIGCLSGGKGYQVIQYKQNGVFETADNKIINIHDTYFGDQYPFGNVYDIFQSKDSDIWLATDKGIFRYHSN